ncbi:MAG: DNA topoisomerase I, partial [Okeania sp. SIO2F4]|uniref:topoisomerase C-terminal repeat-containing protein n=1 Tax=Okeania sp. SIO2F4 TaxID=2607790 RepID=UPI00142C3DFA
LDPEQIEKILKQKTEGPEELGIHPEEDKPIYVMTGRYGPYVQLGDELEGSKKKPKRASLPKGVNMENVTLEMAIGLLSLPRTLGTHPETGCKIQTNLGRFGPYVVHDQGKEGGKDYRSLKAGDDVLTITLERALELLAQPKRARRGSAKATPPLKDLGKHPEDGEAVGIYDGKYGPYVKYGKVNASLPKDMSVEDMTLEKALELLQAKASSKKSTRGRKSTKSKAEN